MSDNIIKQLSEKFTLTGSRRMAEKYPEHIKVSDDSDYDFCGKLSQENIKFLWSLGFEEAVDGEAYESIRHRLVFKHKNIDVILHEEIDNYIQCFESISAYDYMHFYWKSSPHCKLSRDERNAHWDNMYLFYFKRGKYAEYDEDLPT